MTQISKPVIHCAIYTRKSSDEGLDQDFNSLDAQYEAAIAYIGSQKHEGWRLLDRRYDDGGHSGGTMERPALERLLADIDSGLINMVVVYKIDRLTRSLADFARLVERMDKVGCSFVSVTQSFNTSSSMGRLTLNVLLSFAQFEREVTAERIRDKIAASKAKGMWMGGYPPLGYDRHPDDKVRSLVINDAEATIIRSIFASYEATLNLGRTQRHIEQRNIRSKQHRLTDGRIRGGSVMSRGQIQALLANPIYAGLIKHKDKIHQGLHAPIIEPDRWQQVQNLLQSNARKARGKTSQHQQNADQRPLRDVLLDAHGEQMTTSYTIKAGRKYHYYVNKQASKARKSNPALQWRLPAKRIEAIVSEALIAHVDQHIYQQRITTNPSTELLEALNANATQLRESVSCGLSDIVAVIMSVRLIDKTLHIDLAPTELAQRLCVSESELDPAFLSITIPFTLRRRGVETRLVAGIDAPPQKDQTMIATLLSAHKWLDRLKRGYNIMEIAQAEGCSDTYIRSRISMAMLSPSIQSAIVRGQQPAELTSDRLARETTPVDWSEQAKKFGFTNRD